MGHARGVTDQPVRAPLPTKAAETTPEQPWPVRLLSSKIADYVSRMPSVWVEGQVVDLNAHNSSGTAWVTLRDTDVDMSITLTMAKRILLAIPGIAVGAHVVVHGRPEYWVKRGTLQLSARTIRAVGVGDLLARVEELRRVLAAEGLFDADRKRPLPFLPGRVGLICAPRAKARDDVVVNARARWPQVHFEIREVAVQGPRCVPQVVAAITDLDAHPDVDVIVVTRGGGAVEDLLPFSNEAMVRAAAACTTPLVSAIGHESDSPLLDLVADLRASTPTDAAERVVPDVGRERAAIAQARLRVGTALRHRLVREQDRLEALRARPVLADPTSIVAPRFAELDRLRDRARTRLGRRLDAAATEVHGLRTAVRTLSPHATLQRGYAVLRTPDGAVVRAPDDAPAGTHLRARLADGELGVVVEDDAT